MSTPIKHQQRQSQSPATNGGCNMTPGGGGSLSMNTMQQQQQQQQQRSLHTQLPRSRNNSKEFMGVDKANATSHFNSSNTVVYMDGTTGTGIPTQTIMTLPESPSGRSSINNANTISNTGGHVRRRFNSRDMQQSSYSNQYTTEMNNNLLPLERSHYIIAQNVSFVVFFSTYLTLIAILQLVSASIMSTATNVSITLLDPLTHYLYIILSSSWTITNGLHCLLTLFCLHWFKGSALIDEQGELNGMTIWEQLEATCESTTYMRRTFIIMPIVLAYIACLVNKFQPTICTINLIFLSIIMFAKLPQMNGVRLFGINRTAGIDDEFVTDETTNTTTTVVPGYRDHNTIQLTMPVLPHPTTSTLPYAKRD